MTTGSHSEPCINWPCAKGAGHAGPCGTSRDELSSKTLAKWPERIYLQRDYECAEEGCGPHSGDDGETTWCKDKIHDTDVEYVRADLVRVSDEPSALLLVPCPRCGGTGKLKPYKLEGDTEWRVADCPEKHVTAEPPSARLIRSGTYIEAIIDGTRYLARVEESLYLRAAVTKSSALPLDDPSYVMEPGEHR